MTPLAIDLFCGLGGWAEGFLAEGYKVVGFDIERHDYGTGGYPGQLVIQDVLTIDGARFRDATVIVASPPCQAYSYRAMPWKKAKALPPPDNSLFNTCFRIQREASEAAGRHVPLIVENVRGAQPWVGRAAWHYGSFYLWGDIPALMPIVLTRRMKYQCSAAPRMWKDREIPRLNQCHAPLREQEGYKGIPHRTKGHWTNPAEHEDGTKNGGDWFGPGASLMRKVSSQSVARKAASAQIAKIPFPLSSHIAKVFKEPQSDVSLA